MSRGDNARSRKRSKQQESSNCHQTGPHLRRAAAFPEPTNRTGHPRIDHAPHPLSPCTSQNILLISITPHIQTQGTRRMAPAVVSTALHHSRRSLRLRPAESQCDSERGLGYKSKRGEGRRGIPPRRSSRLEDEHRSGDARERSDPKAGSARAAGA